MTAGILAIGALYALGVFLLGYAICRNDSDPMIFGVAIIIGATFATGVRSLAIEEDINTRLCIEKGHTVVEVFGTKVCKL